MIENEGKKGEVLHGDISYIKNRIEKLKDLKEEKIYKLGVLGVPSDWLISSNVDTLPALRDEAILAPSFILLLI